MPRFQTIRRIENEIRVVIILDTKTGKSIDYRPNQTKAIEQWKKEQVERGNHR